MQDDRKDLHGDSARREAERHFRKKQIEQEMLQADRQIDLDRLDAELYPDAETATGPPPSPLADSLKLSEIKPFPRRGYTHANLQEAIRKARSLVTAVNYAPHFNFMTAYHKQELITRLRMSECKASLALLRLDPLDQGRLHQITDLERQLKATEDFLRDLTDPLHPIHHEWQSK